jgi:hypothetical protein
MALAVQIAELEQQGEVAAARERVVQDSAFLHTAAFPLNERIGDYLAAPLTLFKCNVLRMMSSPLMPPFDTPGPDELAAFLWVVSPQFMPGTGRQARRRRKAFLKTCRQFVKPAQPVFLTRRRHEKWERQAAEALAIFARTVAAAREYMVEAFMDRPESGGGEGESYYSDFCHISATLMRSYHGAIHFSEVPHLPLKVIYQFLKEIREHSALEAGETPTLWNAQDSARDKILELLNQPN